jgi:hypothetical protein
MTSLEEYDMDGSLQLLLKSSDFPEVPLALKVERAMVACRIGRALRKARHEAGRPQSGGVGLPSWN